MITIRHNIDPTQFKWLWAKYVKAGNIEKHCTACMIGSYSKKFSGTCNPNLSEQTTLVMDEVQEGLYEAIYFCGVVKRGYLHKNPLKNNYQHNVHFAIQPKIGAHDTFAFDGWLVEIEDGVLERIPATYELKDKFFRAPYNSHYYTCRIFRWMVGHFYPQELVNLRHGHQETIEGINSLEIINALIERGYKFAKDFVEGNSQNNQHCWEMIKCDVEKKHGIKLLGCDTPNTIRDKVISQNLINRLELAEAINDLLDGLCGRHYAMDGVPNEALALGCDIEKYFTLGVEEYLDMLYPYQERRVINGWLL